MRDDRSLREDPFAYLSARPRRGKTLCTCLILYSFLLTIIHLFFWLPHLSMAIRIPKILLYIGPFSAHIISVFYLVLTLEAGQPLLLMNLCFGFCVLCNILLLTGWFLYRGRKKLGAILIQICSYVQITTVVLLFLAVICISGPNLDVYLSLTAAILIPWNILHGLKWWSAED